MNRHDFKTGERCTVRFIGCEFGEKDYNGVVVRVDEPRNVIECVMPMIGMKCEFGHIEGERYATPFDAPDVAIIKPVMSDGKSDSENTAEA